MSATPAGRSGVVGVLLAIGLLFVGLKLGRVIDWSWWWVTCPFWAVPAALAYALVVGLLTVGIVKLAIWLGRVL